MPGAAEVQGFRGLNRAVAAALIGPGESPDTTDADFYQQIIGTLGARPGRSRVTAYTGYNYLGMGLLIGQTGQRWRVTATSDGKWHVTGLAWPGLTTPADLSDLTGRSTSEKTRFFQYQEHLYGYDGFGRMMCCDGTRWTQAGIDKADFKPTVAVGGTSTIIVNSITVDSFSIKTPAQFGTGKSKIAAAPKRALGGVTGGGYSYFVTACNSKKFDYLGRACESLPSTISDEIVATVGKAITVSGIPATHDDTQVDSWNIYRNKAGIYDTDLEDEDQDFFYVGSVPMGTTSYTDKTADYVLTGRNRLRFSRNVPMAGTIAAMYGERLFMTGFKPFHADHVTQTKEITGLSITSDVATFTTSTAHGFTAGQSVVTDAMSDAAFEGTFTIVGTPTETTFTAALVHADGTTVETGTAVSPSIYIDFDDGGVPEGVINAWFQKDGDTARYLVSKRVSASRIKILNVVSGSSTIVGFVGSLDNASATIFHKPHVIFIGEYRDPEAAGPEIEVRRYQINVPMRGQPTAMVPFGGSLLVFTHHNTFQISGAGPNREDVRMMPLPLFKGIGCVGPDAFCTVGDSLFFMSTTAGPMMMNGGAPVAVGTPLNIDWYSDLTADELAMIAMGSDDTYVYLSFPVSGKTGNSRTFRFHIQTQTWWEETGLYAGQYIREDAEAGMLATLFALQSRFILLPRYGDTDLVDAAAGTVGASFSKSITNAALTGDVATVTSANHGLLAGQNITIACSDSIFSGTFVITGVTTNTFDFSKSHANVGSEAVTGSVSGTYDFTTVTFNTSGGFETSGAGLEDCTIRIYRSKVLIGIRRISTNTTNKVTWSADTTVPGAGALSLAIGDVWIIGSVCWRWLTRTTDGGEPMKIKEAQRAWALFYQKSNTASMLKNDVFDGVESTKVSEHNAKELVKQLDNSRSNYTLALRLESRNGAVLRALDIDEVVKQENR